MNRRDALISLVTSSVGMAVSSWAAPQAPSDRLSEPQLEILLEELAGLKLQAGEAKKVLASLSLNRFTAKIDPKIQPQSDFDPEVDL